MKKLPLLFIASLLCPVLVSCADDSEQKDLKQNQAAATKPGNAAETNAKAEPTKPEPKGETKKMEVATIAGGCFWCVEAPFIRVKGVEKAISGYTGGKVPDPTYEQVMTGLTGHAEAVQITFDPTVVSYEALLKLFFELHDPTTLNAQGNDHGTQYRSAIFYHDEAQKATAEKVIKELTEAKRFPRPIVTEVTKLGEYYPAEDYHQNYYDTHMGKGTGNYGYVCRVVHPKVEKLAKLGIALKEDANKPVGEEKPAPEKK